MLIKHCDLCESEIRNNTGVEFKIKRKVHYLSFNEGYSSLKWENVDICPSCLSQIVERTKAKSQGAPE